MKKLEINQTDYEDRTADQQLIRKVGREREEEKERNPRHNIPISCHIRVQDKKTKNSS